jgi:hypothetical protein
MLRINLEGYARNHKEEKEDTHLYTLGASSLHILVCECAC